jgi:hypothetical protein
MLTPTSLQDKNNAYRDSRIRLIARDSAEIMEFRLVYDGPLPSAQNNGRVREKNAIRKAIHTQLLELRNIRHSVPNVHKIMSAHKRVAGFTFLPVVSQSHAVYCDLNILFLRTGRPGSIIVDGDIDNRLKTLYDALRLPKNENELPPGAAPEATETPFYCLLEDDSLITGHDVVADRLLVPGSRATEVRLVIHVHIEPQIRSADNLGF